jgi:hypothetical protein
VEYEAEAEGGIEQMLGEHFACVYAVCRGRGM